MPKRRNPPHTYRVGQVFYGRIQIEGQTFRESLHTTDWKTAQKRVKDWIAEKTEAVRPSGSRTWEDAVVAWHERTTADLRPESRRRYLTSLTMCHDVLSGLRLDEIGRRQLAQIVARPGVTNRTRRRDLTAVMNVLIAAEAWGWIESAPDAAAVRRQVRERHDPRLLPPGDEVLELIAACPGNLARLVQLLAQTGLRLEEAAGLRHEQIAPDRSAIRLDHTKSRRRRVVPLCQEAVVTLDDTPRYLGSDWVFWHGRGRRYANPGSMIGRIRRGLGFTWSTHDLRHLYAVRYLQAGGSIYELKQLLGHSSIQTTEVYLDHLTPEQQREVKRTG